MKSYNKGVSSLTLITLYLKHWQKEIGYCSWRCQTG